MTTKFTNKRDELRAIEEHAFENAISHRQWTKQTTMVRELWGDDEARRFDNRVMRKAKRSLRSDLGSAEVQRAADEVMQVLAKMPPVVKPSTKPSHFGSFDAVIAEMRALLCGLDEQRAVLAAALEAIEAIK